MATSGVMVLDAELQQWVFPGFLKLQQVKPRPILNDMEVILSGGKAILVGHLAQNAIQLASWDGSVLEVFAPPKGLHGDWLFISGFFDITKPGEGLMIKSLLRETITYVHNEQKWSDIKHVAPYSYEKICWGQSYGFPEGAAFNYPFVFDVEHFVLKKPGRIAARFLREEEPGALFSLRDVVRKLPLGPNNRMSQRVKDKAMEVDMDESTGKLKIDP